MTIKKWFPLLAIVLGLSVFAAGCSSKDLVSLAKLDKGELEVGDRYGNRVRIENAEEFLKEFKSAKSIKDAEDVRSEIEAEYIFYSNENKVYYDALGKYLIYIEKGKKHVYSADISGLLDELVQLPPFVVLGSHDEEISEWLHKFSRIERPVSLLFERDDQIVLVVMAGKRDKTGYTMTLENVSFLSSSGEMAVDIRLIEPKVGDNVTSYPYEEFTLSKKVDVNVRMIESKAEGDDVVHVPVSVVEKGQNVILFRPERGSILTERVKMTGFARLRETNFVVEVEDGHNVLGAKQVTVSKRAPEWDFFEFWMDLEPATSPYGTIIFVTYSVKDGSRTEELKVPVGFGGK